MNKRVVFVLVGVVAVLLAGCMGMGGNGGDTAGTGQNVGENGASASMVEGEVKQKTLSAISGIESYEASMTKTTVGNLSNSVENVTSPAVRVSVESTVRVDGDTLEVTLSGSSEYGDGTSESSQQHAVIVGQTPYVNLNPGSSQPEWSSPPNAVPQVVENTKANLSYLDQIQRLLDSSEVESVGGGNGSYVLGLEPSDELVKEVFIYGVTSRSYTVESIQNSSVTLRVDSESYLPIESRAEINFTAVGESKFEGRQLSMNLVDTREFSGIGETSVEVPEGVNTTASTSTPTTDG
ncbi:MAG: hypothetical protein SXQ77_02590 [Halobacteria archaeon]|nr:hypothetical protein [Halobacteria archaeon]